MVLSSLIDPAPRSLLESAQGLYVRFFRNRSTSLFPFVPRSVKVLFLLLVLLNSPSLPFVWHIRVWWHALKAYYLVYRKGRKRYLEDWSKRNERDGGLQGLKTRTKRLAWVDDCDYNLHLSNSCYAKNSDPARMDYCIQALSPLFTPGSHAALAASHYIFLKEVPIGSEYVIETRAGGWGEKWFYLVSEFVIYAKKGSSASRAGKAKASVQELENKLVTAVSGTSKPSAESSGIIPRISGPPSGTETPESVFDGPSTLGNDNTDSVKRAAALRAREPRTDGGVVCCLAVFEYCFKIGRVTIPPRIALHYSLQSPNEAGRAHAMKLILSKDQGRKWLRGGWKEEPNADSLGMDIGLAPGSATSASASNGEGGVSFLPWVEQGRKAMEEVNAAISTF